MLISANSNNKYQIFKAKNFCPKNLDFKPQDFYIRIRGFGKNENWANEAIKTTDMAVSLIKRGTLAENVLKLISIGIKKANQKTLDINKKEDTAILRTKREGWLSKDWCDIKTSYSKNRYKSYESRLDKVAQNPLKSALGISFSRPRILQNGEKEISHASCIFINDSLNEIFKLSKNIFEKYVNTDIKPEMLDEINTNIAEIRWILAHATPWVRGSDAISNVFMRAIYKAIGIKTYPISKGISLDLEAYCTEKEEYIKKFPTYFDKMPEIIN